MHIYEYIAKDSKDTPLQTHFGHQHLRKRGNAAVSTIYFIKHETVIISLVNGSVPHTEDRGM
jgi:hypothetical protein